MAKIDGLMLNVSAASEERVVTAMVALFKVLKQREPTDEEVADLRAQVKHDRAMRH
jgi:hypothetical protein